MITPKKVTVREEPEGPVYIYRWGDWGFVILILFGLAFALFPTWILLQNPLPSFIVLFLLVFTAIGLGLIYWSLGHVINRSEIRLQQGRLVARQKPLPWRYNADLPVSEIQNVNQETYFNTSSDDQFGGGFRIGIQTTVRNERLAAWKQGGKKVILIPKLEVAAAQFLAQEIEVRLGLRQALTEAERVVNLQASKQEQRRVESSQGMMLFPVLMLMAPILLIGGIWLLISTFNAQREARASMSWPSIAAQASGYTWTRHEPDSDDSWDAYYDAEMEYTYYVDGESYTIEKYVPERFATEQDLVQFVETNYPPGAPLTVYYNPQNPARALHDRSGPGIIPYILAGVCLVLVPLVLFALVMMAREYCRAHGCPDDWKHWPFWLKQVPILGRAVS
jgi:hypothetical protein